MPRQVNTSKGTNLRKVLEVLANFFFSAGGLVTAVAPVVIDCEGLWVGWTGLDDFNEKIEKIPESDPGDKGQSKANKG